jgi:hypothetical protein
MLNIYKVDSTLNSFLKIKLIKFIFNSMQKNFSTRCFNLMRIELKSNRTKTKRSENVGKYGLDNTKFRIFKFFYKFFDTLLINSWS